MKNALLFIACVIILLVGLGGAIQERENFILRVKIGHLKSNAEREAWNNYKIGFAMGIDLTTDSDISIENHLAIDSLYKSLHNNKQLTQKEKVAIAYHESKKIWCRGEK